jgi:hypothetical protein
VQNKKPESTNALDHVSVGEILLGLPRQSVDEALTTTDRTKRREGRFPDHLVVQFVVLMGLFLESSYDHVLEKLNEALKWLHLGMDDLGDLTNAAITQARQRIGPKPLKELFRKVCLPLCTDSTPYALFRGLTVVLVDGSTFQLADSPENEATFGKSANQNRESGLPQIRCVSLIEHASRAPLDLEFGPYKGSSEQELAKSVLKRLKASMLVVGDRLYACYENCRIVADAGSHFLFRIKKDVKLTPIQRFADGSYTAKLWLYLNRKRQKEHVLVRVIEYRLKDSSEWHRLVTNFIEPHEASVQELVALYPLRWAEETVFREIKTTLKPTRLTLRSKSPDMVQQELYGLFIAYYIIRRLMFKAAQSQGLAPEQLSFKHAVFVLRQQAPKLGDFPP